MSTTPSTSLACRLLAASAASYGIGRGGRFTPPQPAYDTVGFLAPPTVVVGGLGDIDAALVGSSDDGVIVAFRGTIPPAKKLAPALDWIQDLLAEPEACEGFPGKVHTGFHRAWTRLAEGVLAAVKAQSTSGRGVYMTGHSKGGSLASLGAWALREAGYDPLGVITFAAAHVGDRAFAEQYDAALAQIRYENHLDLVPFLPPTAELAGVMSKLPIVGRLFKDEGGWDYAKVGRLRYITEKGAVIGGEPGLDVLRLAEILGSSVKDEGGEVLAAHSLVGPGGYCRGVCPEGVCVEGTEVTA